METSDDPKTFKDAKSLLSYIIDFKFLFGMVIWYNILSVINRVSKMLQSKDIVIDAVISHLKALIFFSLRPIEKLDLNLIRLLLKKLLLR